MQIPFLTANPQPAFGYRTILKTLWLKGKLPSVTRDLYGLPLTKRTVTNEHLVPYCFSRDSSLKNIALANKYVNNFRGNKPLKNFVSFEQVKAYYSQFEGVKLKNFDGDLYKKQGLETCKRLGIEDKTNKR